MPSTAAARDAAYRGLVRRKEEYQQVWWTDDAWVEHEIARNPALVDTLAALSRTRLVQTIDVHKRVRWSAKRQQLHDSIISQLTPPGVTGAPIAAVITLGLPGSGKSSILRRIATRWARRVVDATLDADDFRARLPEYANGLGSQVVQDETTELVYGPLYGEILDDPASDHPLIVIDTVGDPAFLPRTAERLADAGWPVAALLADLPLGEAVQRARNRALSHGRIVDEEYLRSRDGVPASGLQALIDQGLLDAGWARIDASAPMGQAPRVVDGDGAFGPNGAATPYW